MPIAQAWKALDEQGIPLDSQLTEQLQARGREVALGSCQFALQLPTTEDAARAEAKINPLGEQEAESA